MRNNFNYWIGKDERAKQARKHTEEMQRAYGECGIPEAIKNTKVYDTNFSCQNSVPNKHCIISVEPLDTVQAAACEEADLGSHPAGSFQRKASHKTCLH